MCVMQNSPCFRIFRIIGKYTNVNGAVFYKLAVNEVAWTWGTWGPIRALPHLGVYFAMGVGVSARLICQGVVTILHHFIMT